jgi:hypothetical protein
MPLRSIDLGLAAKTLGIAQSDRGGAGRPRRNCYLAAPDELIFSSPVIHRVSRDGFEGVRYE